jgi:hypothetical protein
MHNLTTKFGKIFDICAYLIPSTGKFLKIIINVIVYYMHFIIFATII